MPSNSIKVEEHTERGDAHESSKEEHIGVVDGKWAVIQSMIKQVRNGTPIYRIHLPIFLQEPRSLLERYADFCSHMDIFTSVADIENPEQRFLTVVKFYLAGWHSRPKELRNPFNPILGEVFQCHYAHPDSTTQYIAEQISHHPPSSAFCVINENKGMYLTAYVRPSSHFKGNSMDTTLQGRLAGHSRNHNEDYEITFPHFVVKGLIFGGLHLTLCGNARLACPQSGYSADLDFRSAGYFTGQPNYVHAKIRHTSHKKSLYTIEGRWDEVLTISSRNGNKQVFFDCHASPITTPAIVAPISQQAENESRRVWDKVVQNILRHNESEALKEKSIVEESQRTAERERKEKKIEWTPKLFTKVKDDFYVPKSFSNISPIFSG
eukprot:Phypoly_transcript_10885.p1 GENE.Phypoly_transcript_10885~~Phypoly_transcript_10885.p1  ORF type:complete len:379 (+),score=41.72 Phypoly_transcript_10885:70-1206(+)